MHASDHVTHIYYDDPPGQSTPKQHKEDLKHICNADDKTLIDAEVEKYPHPLEGQLPHLYNTLTGKIAFRQKITNEHDALMKIPIVKSFPSTSHLTN